MLFIFVLLLACVGSTVAEDEDKAPVPLQPCPIQCKSTCRNPNPPNCSPNPACRCSQPGYVFQSINSNNCIPTYQCPTNAPCNGDINAVIQSPVIACRATCQRPEQTGCNKPNLPVGCVCKTNYILNRPGGRCIRANRCPCGDPCHGGNRTFVNCFFNCPYHFCPRDDSNVFQPCDPVWPCPTGCKCKNGYLLSDGECIYPQDCPPVECTRPNEEWDSCPPSCYTDYCYDVPNFGSPCDTSDPFACKPSCRCIDGFARGNDGLCVPIADCPP